MSTSFSNSLLLKSGSENVCDRGEFIEVVPPRKGPGPSVGGSEEALAAPLWVDIVGGADVDLGCGPVPATFFGILSCCNAVGM